MRRFVGHASLLLMGACFGLTVARDFDAYMKWLRTKKHYTFGTVRAIDNDNEQGMLVATQAIGDNFLIAKLPSESVFSEETVNLTLSGFGCDDEVALDGLDSRTRLVATLLQEQDNPETTWKPMFEAAPKAPTMPPSFWAEQDINLLQGSGILHEVLKERKIYEREYDKMSQKCPAFGEHFPLASFLSAGAFIGRTGIGAESIVPFMDLANHDPNPNAEIGQVQDEGIIAMVSVRDIRAGEEITINYNVDNSGSGRSDLRLFTLRGFVPENVLPMAKIILPSCTPPSLLSSADAGEDDLPPCCQDAEQTDDAFCFGEHVRTPDIEKTLSFGIQMPLGKKTKHTAVADLSDVLQRIRSVLADSGFLPNCPAKTLDLHRPLDITSEREVMRIFQALLSAHLSESAWAAAAGVAATSDAAEERKAAAKAVHEIERPVLEWFVEFTEHADRFLQFSDPEKLQLELCSEILDKSAKAKQPLLSKFGWLVEHILAPLAFSPRFENGEPCSVEDATYKMKVKECKELLAAEKKSDEL